MSITATRNCPKGAVNGHLSAGGSGFVERAMRYAEIAAIHSAWSSMRYERKAMAAGLPSEDTLGEVEFYRVDQRRLMKCHGSKLGSGSEELTNFGRGEHAASRGAYHRFRRGATEGARS